MSLLRTILMTQGGDGEHPPLDLTGQPLYFVGNSITAGTYTTTPGNEYTTVATNLLGGVEHNLGEPGSTVMKRSPLNPLLGGVNLVDRSGLVASYNALTGGAIISPYGMNDAGFNSPNYTVPNFIEDYSTAITDWLDRGWPAGRILICSPSYATDAAFTFYFTNPNWSIPAPPDRARFDAFRDACAEVAGIFNTRYLDLNTATKNSGLLGSLDADGVHPNSPNDDLMIFIGTTIAESFGVV